MKKSKKAALIIAAAMIALGAVLSVGAAASVGFDFSVINTPSFEEKEYTVNESFSDIYIDGKDCNVRFYSSDDGKCRVVCGENKNVTHTVEVKDNKLNIIRNDNRRWYMMIGVSVKEYEISVYLPQKKYGELKFKSGSGDIFVPEDLSFASFDVSTGSGNIDMFANVDGVLAVNTSSGDVKIENSSPSDLDVNTVSGNMNISDINVTESINIKSSSGDIKFSGAETKDISAETSSGEMKFYDVNASGEIYAESRSGDVVIEKSDAGSLYIKTSSGDVSGSLLTDKIYITETSSGDIKVPRSDSGGKCEIITKSGDIKFE